MFRIGLWADFGLRIAISENKVREDRLMVLTVQLLCNPPCARRSAHKPPLT